MRLLRRAVAVALGAVLTAVPGAAVAVSAPLALISADVTAYPSVMLKVAAPVPPAEQGADVPAAAFEVLEDGEPRSVTAVGPSDAPLEVVLLVDSSADAGEALVSAAVDAVDGFLQQVPEYARVAVVSFGGDATVVTPMTAEPEQALSDLPSIQSEGQRALFDAVVTAVGEYSAAPSTRRSMVLVTAGTDTGGAGSLGEATRSLAGSRASLYVIDATIDGDRPQEVDELVKAAGGGVLSTDDANALAALYDRVGRRLGNEYRLTFQAEGNGPTDLTVRFSHEGITDELTRTLTLPAPSQAPGQTEAPAAPGTSGEAAPAPPQQAAPGARDGEGADGVLGDVTMAVVLLIIAVALFAAGLVAFFWKRTGLDSAVTAEAAVAGMRAGRGVAVPPGRGVGAPPGRGVGAPPGAGAVDPVRDAGGAVEWRRPGAPVPGDAPRRDDAAGAVDRRGLAAPVPGDAALHGGQAPAVPEEALLAGDDSDAAVVLAEHGQVAARPGEVGYLAVAADEPRDEASRGGRRLVVALTLTDPSDRQVLAVHGERALLRVRLDRMVGELQDAGAVGTADDLACLTGADAERVRAMLRGAGAGVRDDTGDTGWDDALDAGDTRHYRWGLLLTLDEARSIDAHFTRHGSLPVQPGELCHLAIAADEAPDKPIRACRRVPVRLPVTTARDLAVSTHDGPDAMRRLRMRRIAREAQVQHGLLTVGDLAHLLGVPADTVARDVLAIRITGEAVPLFGSVRVGEVGPARPAVLVERFLSGEPLRLAPDDAGVLSDFASTVRLHRQGVEVADMHLGGPVGAALLGQYVALFERARRERGGVLRLGELLQSELATIGPAAPQVALGRIEP